MLGRQKSPTASRGVKAIGETMAKAFQNIDLSFAVEQVHKGMMVICTIFDTNMGASIKCHLYVKYIPQDF